MVMVLFPLAARVVGLKKQRYIRFSEATRDQDALQSLGEACKKESKKGWGFTPEHEEPAVMGGLPGHPSFAYQSQHQLGCIGGRLRTIIISFLEPVNKQKSSMLKKVLFMRDAHADFESHCAICTSRMISKT